MPHMTTDLVQITQKGHNTFGGSSAKFWRKCYGWAALNSTLPPQPTNVRAERGTALHTGVLERKTHAEIVKRQTGEILSIRYDDIPNWPEEGYLIADGFWQAIWKHVLEEFVTGKVIYIEKKLMLYPEDDAGGTADFIVLYYNDKGKLVAVLGDLKTGIHRVEPDEEQLLFYLTALYLRLQEKGKEIDIFKSFIYQPTHVDPATGEPRPYTEHTFPKSAILKAAKDYKKAIIASKAEKPKFKAGDHCYWCKAKPICKEYSKYIGKHMDQAVQGNALPSVEQLDDSILLNIFLYGEEIEAYISSVRKHIFNRFVNNKPLEGIKVINGVAKRRWRDQMEAIDTLREHGINPTKEVIVGIGAAESLLKGQGKTKDEVYQIMHKLTEKPLPPPKLVPITDPRQAVSIQQVNMLEAFDAEE